jgi:hypothetical protein
MGLIIPNEGELELLDKMLKVALLVDEDYLLKLYKNNYTPDASSTASNFIEADFTGYSAKTLLRSNWNTSTTVSGKASTNYPQQTWTCGVSTNDVYGYYVLGADSGIVLWTERFANTKTLEENDVINLTLRFTLRSEL